MAVLPASVGGGGGGVITTFISLLNYAVQAEMLWHDKQKFESDASQKSSKKSANGGGGGAPERVENRELETGGGKPREYLLILEHLGWQHFAWLAKFERLFD